MFFLLFRRSPKKLNPNNLTKLSNLNSPSNLTQNKRNRQPLNLHQQLQRLLFLAILLVVPSPQSYAAPAISFNDKKDHGLEVLTLRGATPHATYTLEMSQGGYQTTGTTNECGILEVKVPSSFGAIHDGTTGNQYGFVYVNGAWKYIEWQNHNYTGKDEFGKKYAATVGTFDCNHLTDLQRWGWSWNTAASKTRIKFWEQGVFENNSSYPVMILGDRFTPGSGRTYKIKRKANACGIVSYSYYYMYNSPDPKIKGYVVDYKEPFVVKQDGTTVFSYLVDWDQYETLWRETPFCKNGRTYETDKFLWAD